jgi:hypothetical protein
MNEQKPIARRGTPRFELEKELSGHTHYSSHTHLIDLSSSGALIEFQQYLQPGTELVLSLPLGGSSHCVPCSVVHCSIAEAAGPTGEHGRTNYRIGLQFKGLSAVAKTTINELMKNRLEHERREQPRLYIGRPAQLEETVELQTVNLGMSGGLFVSNSPLEYGSQYDFAFKLPTGEVRAHGVVRHCQAWARAEAKRFQVGVEFKEFKANGHEKVREYLRLLAKKTSS